MKSKFVAALFKRANGTRASLVSRRARLWTLSPYGVRCPRAVFVQNWWCWETPNTTEKISTTLPPTNPDPLTLALERVHDVHRRDGLAARFLTTGDRVADDVLEEHLEDTAGLLVDEARDALDPATASEAADGGR